MTLCVDVYNGTRPGSTPEYTPSQRCSIWSRGLPGSADGASWNAHTAAASTAWTVAIADSLGVATAPQAAGHQHTEHLFDTWPSLHLHSTAAGG